MFQPTTRSFANDLTRDILIWRLHRLGSSPSRDPPRLPIHSNDGPAATWLCLSPAGTRVYCRLRDGILS